METASTKIIFLDIDGVMCTHNHMRWQERTNGSVETESWSPKACRNLSFLCKQFNARIVISSTWRIHRDMQELRNIFKSNYIDPDLLVDATPILMYDETDEIFCRGDEIKGWLKKNDCCTFAIIDDIPASEFLEEQQKNLVIVDPNNGLSAKEALIRAAKILGDD